MILIQDDIDMLKGISRTAGAAIMEIYNDDDFGIENKEDDSPLTKADKAANTIICDGLARLEATYPIISEENKEIPYSVRSEFDRFWLVDPLDGTKEFIKRNGEFTVNIALIEKGIPVAGFVFAPVLNQLFWAVKDMGAYCEEGKSVTPLQANEYQNTDRGLRVVCSRSHLNEETQSFIDQFESPEKVSKGSSLKFLLIALGEAEVYPRLAPTMEWDTGAAQAILEAAGGIVINHETNQPLVYNKESLLNPWFVARGSLVS